MKRMNAALVAIVLAGCAARIPAPVESQLAMPENWRSQSTGNAEPGSQCGVWRLGGTRALLE